MKKLLISCLVVLMVYTNMVSALADTQYATVDSEFTIRGGVHYGSTKEEIDAIEKNNGSSPTDTDTFYGETYDLSYTTPLAGHPACVTYWMDSNGILDEFQYLLYTNESYMDIKSALVDKYGAPMNTASTSTALIVGTGIDRISEQLKVLSPYDKDYSGWLIKYNDCFLMIETKNIYIRKAGNSLYVVNYDILSYDEMQSLQVHNEVYQEFKDTSINNDL